MSQQISSRSPPGTKQRIVQHAPSSPSPCPFQSGISSPILQLQRTLGNQRVTQLIRARRLTPQGGIIGLQPKLTVGAADDQYEQEADRVARQVMTMPIPDTPSNSMRRVTAPQDTLEEKTVEEDEDNILQTRPLSASITSLTQRQAQEEKDAETPRTGSAGSLADSFEVGEDVESRL
ncbi:hypothetical protein, partial [Nitrosospira sp. NpAV]|uniref:hypothetical protein n=1 Tax=Nitrosospira sp. NpAV TaxID=58133 RepID=UPI0018DBBD73